eukprot:GEMP01088035.1.p1 GENE.GEMP01088035.1~~GEMP01088035.1.p1  ORF type:complete len:105 (+),score=5.33 GEMP01088035.1:418-732(+)
MWTGHPSAILRVEVIFSEGNNSSPLFRDSSVWEPSVSTVFHDCISTDTHVQYDYFLFWHFFVSSVLFYCKAADLVFLYEQQQQKNWGRRKYIHLNISTNLVIVS